MYVKKDYVWNPVTCNCENGIYLASIIDESAIMCDEIIESYEEDAETKLYKETNAIGLLIAVSIYCYLKKYRAKQNNLLPFNFTKTN